MMMVVDIPVDFNGRTRRFSSCIAKDSWPTFGLELMIGMSAVLNPMYLCARWYDKVGKIR